jgi:hypothetical protein
MTHGVSLVRVLSALGLAVAIGATAAAQSLGELAKQEEARRKAIKAPGKVLTNDTIRSIPVSSSGAAPAPASTPSKDKEKDKDSDATADKKPKPEDDRKTQETTWRTRIQGARDAVLRNQMFAEALQSRINGLSADFTARDDPAQRAAVANERQKALAELDRVKNDIVKQTKAIADIQEEARKAGVPPGWLR